MTEDKEILFTDDLMGIVKRAFCLGKKYRISRAGETDMFWLSSNYNSHHRIFSVQDLVSFWNVYEVEEDV